MAASHELFALIRLEIFDAESLEAFGARLGYDKSHIYRMETGAVRIQPRHVGLCRQLRVPPGRKGAMEALLVKLGDAVAAEELARLQARKDAALRTRRARERANEAARQDSIWQASWAAAVEYLHEEAVWMGTCEALLTAELVRNHLAGMAAWRATSDTLIAAQLASRFVHRRRWRVVGASAAVGMAAACLLLLAGRSPKPDPECPPDLSPSFCGPPTSRKPGASMGQRSRQLPAKPLKYQKQKPCDPPEVEINGGCWLPIWMATPCGPRLFEYAGKCYSPVAESPAEPVSSDEPDGGTPVAPATNGSDAGY